MSDFKFNQIQIQRKKEVVMGSLIKSIIAFSLVLTHLMILMKGKEENQATFNIYRRRWTLVPFFSCFVEWNRISKERSNRWFLLLFLLYIYLFLYPSTRTTPSPSPPPSVKGWPCIISSAASFVFNLARFLVLLSPFSCKRRFQLKIELKLN